MMLRYHDCNRPLWVAAEWTGQAWTRVFMDETGKNVSHCPGCAEALGPWAQLQAEPKTEEAE